VLLWLEGADGIGEHVTLDAVSDDGDGHGDGTIVDDQHPRGRKLADLFSRRQPRRGRS
jgi:hypothetical protein